MKSSVWITWETQRRNRTLSKALGAKLFEFDYNLSRLVKYPFLLIKTLTTFIKEKTDLIFVQNPSLLLAFFAVNYGRFFKIPVVVDAHNAGVYPFNGTRRWANSLTRYLFKHADFTIVTNGSLAKHVKINNGNPVILPDPLPEFEPPVSKPALPGNSNILFICSWADDEPYGEVIKATEFLDSMNIYITGNSKGKEKKVCDSIPGNVVLTGYLSEKEYVAMLHSCDVILDLTTREDCLVCGAYEAISAEKPLVLSGNAASRRYFSRGVLFTDNSHKSIAEQITKALSERDALAGEIRILKEELKKDWEYKRMNFAREIERMY